MTVNYRYGGRDLGPLPAFLDRADLACRPSTAPWFYPPVVVDSSGQVLDRPSAWDTDQAKALCHACPARRDCLEHALTHHEQGGIWGGMTQKERAAETQRRYANQAARRG